MKMREKHTRIWSSAYGTWLPAGLWHLWSSHDWKSESSISKRKHKLFSSNSWQIDRCSATLNVPWMKEELDTVDGGLYPWFYSDWPQIILGRTNCSFLADHALSDISEEMIKLSFSKCIQEMNSFTLVLSHFLCCLILFIFPKV